MEDCKIQHPTAPRSKIHLCGPTDCQRPAGCRGPERNRRGRFRESFLRWVIANCKMQIANWSHPLAIRGGFGGCPFVIRLSGSYVALAHGAYWD